MKIALIGYGKMGRAIEEIALAKGHEIVAKTGRNGFSASDIYEADVCIEFSSPESGYENIRKCIQAHKPVVSGTTGWLDQKNLIDRLVTEKDGAFLYASNFSIGVNIFFTINSYLARIMNHFSEYDVNVHEIHHTQKKDAPSGTAITTAEIILHELQRKKGFRMNSTDKDLLNITAERKDPAPGTHEVKYSSAIDDIQIIHTAHNRTGFASGAILAAEWIIGKKGIYNMEDMLNLNALK